MINNLFSLVSRMSGIQRFSMLKLCHRENVLEHTGMVCVFCYALVDRLNADHHGRDHIDMGEVLRRAVVHDTSESATGDITRPVKYFSPELRLAMAKLENAALDNLQRQLKLPSIVMDYAIAKQGKPGVIVALADIMSSIHRAWEETIIYSNHHFVSTVPGMRKVLQNVMGDAKKENFTEEQFRFLEDVARDLNLKLDKVAQHDCDLVELHSDVG